MNAYFLQNISQTPYPDLESHCFMASRFKLHFSQVPLEPCRWPLLGTKYTTKPSHRLFLLCCPQMENSQVSCNILPSSRTLPTSDCGYMTTEELAESCPQNVRVPVHTDERLVTGILSGLSQRLYWFQVSVMTGLVMLGAACWKQICALSSIKGSSWTLTSE